MDGSSTQKHQINIQGTLYLKDVLLSSNHLFSFKRTPVVTNLLKGGYNYQTNLTNRWKQKGLWSLNWPHPRLHDVSYLRTMPKDYRNWRCHKIQHGCHIIKHDLLTNQNGNPKEEHLSMVVTVTVTRSSSKTKIVWQWQTTPQFKRKSEMYKRWIAQDSPLRKDSRLTPKIESHIPNPIHVPQSSRVLIILHWKFLWILWLHGKAKCMQTGGGTFRFYVVQNHAFFDKRLSVSFFLSKFLGRTWNKM